MGWYGQRAFADDYFRDSSNRGAVVSSSPTDDQLRALAGMIGEGTT